MNEQLLKENIIDIYYTSGIRALLTHACEICTTRRTINVYCTIFYLGPPRIKKNLFENGPLLITQNLT
jgi:hypothetical protein